MFSSITAFHFLPAVLDHPASGKVAVTVSLATLLIVGIEEESTSADESRLGMVLGPDPLCTI